MSVKEIRKNKVDLSKRLHVVPPKAYAQQISNAEKNLQHHVNYHEKKRSTPPRFSLPPYVPSKFPKKFVTAREV